MSYISVHDERFCATVESWFSERSRVLVLIRFSHMAGQKDFELYSAWSELVARIRGLPPLTCVIAFKDDPFVMRGIVDDDFITACLNRIAEGTEYLLLETKRRTYGVQNWYHHAYGATHAELEEDLEHSRGSPVEVGQYPDWMNDSEAVVSAVVPNENGKTSCGVY